MPVRRLCLLLLLLPLGSPASAQTSGSGIDVIDVSGPLDNAAADFIVDSVHRAADSGQGLALILINSPAFVGDDDRLAELATLVVRPPLPVALWVGPAPATAYGGVAQLVAIAPERAAAPGADIGRLYPTIAGDDQSLQLPGFSEALIADVEGQPSVRQYLQALDERVLPTISGHVEVRTLRPLDDGVTLVDVTFRKPGLLTRALRLAITPEAAFFFLAIGMTLAAFEFYAIGPGLAAVVALVSLLLGSWGLSQLPTRWWGLALVVAGWSALTASHQKGGVAVLSGVGAVAVFVGGMNLIDGSGQIDMRWWLVLLVVAAVLFFYLLAMPTVHRARFSTRTIGAGALMGKQGVALVDFAPDGEVEVQGARWKATAHREAGISKGSAVVVVEVRGLLLEVERQDRENEL